jgi:O-antigen ligase
MKANWQNRAFNYWPLAFAFALPFGGILLSWVIAAWAIHSFTLIPIRIKKNGWHSIWFYSLILFFLLTVISALLSTNAKEGATAIEVKLSFLLLPYLLFLFRYPKIVYYQSILSYVLGLIISLIVLLVMGSVQYLQNGKFPYYMDFSYFLHPSYLGMYLGIGIILLLVTPKEKLMYLERFPILTWGVILFLCFGVVLSASKMGMISLILTLPFALLYRMRHFFTVKKALYLGGGLLILGFFFTRLFPESLNRLYAIQTIDANNMNKTSTESTEVRLLIWKECKALVSEIGLMGFDVGDVNDKLYERYQQQGLTGAYEHRLNAHNQFFQTLLGMGYIGGLVLFFLTLGFTIFGFIKRQWLFSLIGFIFILNFCVESMLQTSAGNLEFVFILTLLTSFYETKEMV